MFSEVVLQKVELEAMASLIKKRMFSQNGYTICFTTKLLIFANILMFPLSFVCWYPICINVEF